MIILNPITSRQDTIVFLLEVTHSDSKARFPVILIGRPTMFLAMLLVDNLIKKPGDYTVPLENKLHKDSKKPITYTNERPITFNNYYINEYVAIPERKVRILLSITKRLHQRTGGHTYQKIGNSVINEKGKSGTLYISIFRPRSFRTTDLYKTPCQLYYFVCNIEVSNPRTLNYR